MKKYIIGIVAALPFFANAYCSIPSMTQNTFLNQQLQQQYQECLRNQQFQQQQIQIQQEQLNIQRQQLQIQQQQNNRMNNNMGGNSGGLNFDLLRR